MRTASGIVAVSTRTVLPALQCRQARQELRRIAHGNGSTQISLCRGQNFSTVNIPVDVLGPMNNRVRERQRCIGDIGPLIFKNQAMESGALRITASVPLTVSTSAIWMGFIRRTLTGELFRVDHYRPQRGGGWSSQMASTGLASTGTNSAPTPRRQGAVGRFLPAYATQGSKPIFPPFGTFASNHLSGGDWVRCSGTNDTVSTWSRT